MADEPIAYTKDGRPLFDNTPTVVCVLLSHVNGLVAVRRANDPGKGLLGLPGGYHMRGESWEEAGSREVLEETGFRIDPHFLTLRDLVTDEYGNNLIIARYGPLLTMPAGRQTDGEALEVVYLNEIGQDSDWAFPRHRRAARHVLENAR